MRWRAARFPSPARRSIARPAAPKAARPRSRKWPSAIMIIARNGPPRLERAHDRNHRRRHYRHPADRAGAEAAEDRDYHRTRGGRTDARSEQARDQADQMPLVGILVAVVL